MSTEHTLTQLRQIIQGIDCGESQYKVLERIANEMQSDLKRYEDIGKLQDIGKSAYDSLAEMVAALECDYDRLKELREARSELASAVNLVWDGSAREPKPDMASVAGAELIAWDDENADELKELEAAAGECTSREEAETRIQEDALSVEVRSDWHTPGAIDSSGPTEFMILLSTGGPAVRIMGELDNSEPVRAWLEVQDWGTPWTRYFGIEQDTLLTYARCFYFGEG